MITKLKHTAVLLLLILATTGCDDKITEFEIVGNTSAPAAIDVNKVSSEALPGQINLTWEAPEGDFAYLKIKYYDPKQKKDVYKLASKGTTEMLIDETRARYGDYTFYFQTFNDAHQGGDIQTVKAKSGAAPSVTTVVSKEKINITAGQLSTNAQEPSEGPIANLVDGKSNTFFHTRWSSPQIDLPQYIQVKFNEPHENVSIYYQNRTDNTWTTAGRPSVVELQISNNGEAWETVTELSGLPSAHSSTYTSDYIAPGKTFTYFRFNVTATTGATKYFNLAEYAMYDVELAVYDPETDEEEL
ncbi:discoidin domain-containing protein [Bacteroides sp. OttesenSCG-928-F21]|nr:discoidin domain-containing protein [Bacteroides sp. OttesenSCG-928-F21]